MRMNPYIEGFVRHGSKALFRRIAKAVLGKKVGLTPETNYAIYEPMRQRLLDKFEADPPPAHRYVAEMAEGQPNMMLDGKPTQDAVAVFDRYFSDLSEQIRRYAPRSIIEVGSGYGRNIIGLADQDPSLELLGLELTKSSVELSRKAATHYGLNCRFREFDVTKEWDDVPVADVVFSVHALESIPDASGVVDNMVAHARKAVIMFEPFPDFWTGWKGLASKLKVLHSERLWKGSLRNHTLSVVEPLDYSSHVLNAPTLVVIEKTSNGLSGDRAAV